MTILPANESHIPGIIALLHQVGDVHHEIRPDIFRAGALKYDETVLKEILSDETKPIFAAVEGESVLGYCFCQLRTCRGSTVLTDREELYIDDVCVDETVRGKGIAQALYHHTLAFAKEKGCAFVTLNVWEGNHRAAKFYEKMGMTPRSTNMEIKLC